MASTDKSVVSYGQFGRPTYSRIDRKWQYQRNADYTPTLEPVGLPQILRRPEAAHDDQLDSFNHDNPSRRRKKQIQTLIQAHPELQPASDLLPEFTRVSEAVEDAAAHFDLNKSHLLAFGTVVDEAAKRLATIAAFPTGVSGEDLCLAVCHNVDTGWEDSRRTFLTVPTVSGERSVWSGPGVPIQQIVFACPQERGHSNFLAVRLMTKTLIFRPILKRSTPSLSSLPDPNLLVEIAIDQTGGSPHAHVSFNPWYTRQVGIIDQAGRWSVWEMTGRSCRSVERMYHGELRRDRPSDAPSRDVWARILWCTNPTTLVLCDRYEVDTLELSSKTNAEETMPPHASGISKNWILDMTTFPNRPAHFAVLTATHVAVYHLDDSAIDHPAKCSLLCLQHRLSPLDISLSMRCFMDGIDYFLMLYSATTDVILVFPLQFVSDGLVTAADPFQLIPNFGPRTGILGLHVEQVHFGGRMNTTRGLAASYAAKQMMFFSITALTKGLSITRLVYVADRSHGRNKTRPLAWERKNPTSSSEISTQADLIDDESSEAHSNTQHNRTSWQRPVSAFLQRLREGTNTIEEHDRTVPAHFVYRELDSLSDEHATGFGEIIEEATAIIRNSEHHLPLQTLRELLSGEVTLGDADSAVGHLESLRQAEHGMQTQHVEYEPMDSETRSPQVLRDIHLHTDAGGDAATKDTAAIYRELSRKHNAGPLTVLSDLMQSARDGHALRLAAEVSLASQVLRPEYTPITEQSDSQPQYQYQSQSEAHSQGLPSSQPLSISSAGIPFYDSFGISSQLASTLPTPSPTATPSLISTSSNPSSLGSLELTALSKYTTFSKPITTSVVPRLQRTILNEWTIGAEPSTYDWQPISGRLLNNTFAIDPTDPDETEMTDRERRSIQRKAERHMRRQRREAEESRRLNAQRNLLPTIQSSGAIPSSASQPDQLRLPVRTASRTGFRATQQMGHAQSSQDGAAMSSSQLQGPPVASQILPGRHGGRAPVRKKRKSGF